MKKEGHPKYVTATIHCGCGNTFTTRSTVGNITIDVCSQCHPFFTGKQRIVDAAGRVDKFNRRVQQAAAAKA
jgi:large subunit ribosomal protein L31